MHSNNDPRTWRISNDWLGFYVVDEDGADMAGDNFSSWEAAKDWLDQAIRDDLAAQAQEAE